MSVINNSLEVYLRPLPALSERFESSSSSSSPSTSPKTSINDRHHLGVKTASVTATRNKDRYISASWYLNKNRTTMPRILQPLEQYRARISSCTSHIVAFNPREETETVAACNKEQSKWSCSRNELNYRLAKALRNRRNTSAVKTDL